MRSTSSPAVNTKPSVEVEMPTTVRHDGAKECV